MRKTGYDMLYLCICAAAGCIPEQKKCQEMDLEKLYRLSQSQSLTAMVCYALESAGITDGRFVEAKEKSIRKNLLFDVERRNICDFMEQEEIRHLPLKGIILKEFYPKPGMRQMSDNDILYDGDYQKRLAIYMVSQGYKAECVGRGNHDVFMKPPVFNFEMHTSLFDLKNKELREYYDNVWERLCKVEGTKASFQFTDEDFYIYLMAHDFKHFSGGGKGLRSLVDCAVYLKKKPELNRSYIVSELEKLGIDQFEARISDLVRTLFLAENQAAEINKRYDSGWQELTSEEKELLEFHLFSGTYGTLSTAYTNMIHQYQKESGKKSKLSYVLHRVFPDSSFYKNYYPFLYKYKIFIPFFVIYRILRLLFTGRKRALTEWNSLKKYESE